MAAMPETATVITSMMRPKVSSISVWVVTVKSSSPRWRWVRTLRSAATTAGTSSAVAATTSISCSSATLNRSMAVATGMKAVSSRSKPSSWPLASITPTTRNEKPPIRTRWPSGEAAPNSSRVSLAPRTAWAPLRSGSTRGRNEPWATVKRHAADASQPTPYTNTARPRPLPSTRAWPKATGTTWSTPGRRRSASLSAMVSLWVVPPSTPGRPMVLTLPGLTATRLVPNWVN